MQPRSVVGVFCEDIRIEKNGVVSLVGIMPDSANIPAAPTPEQHAMMPKLCIYARVQFDPTDEVKNISTAIYLPDGNKIDMGPVSEPIITRAVEGATQKGNPLAIVVLRAEFQAFPIISLGHMRAEVTVNDTNFIAAQIKIVVGEKGEEQLEETRQMSQRIEKKPISSSELQPPS